MTEDQDRLLSHLAERVTALESRLGATPHYREIEALRADQRREADKTEADLTHGLNAVRDKINRLLFAIIGLGFGVLGVALQSLIRSAL